MVSGTNLSATTVLSVEELTKAEAMSLFDRVCALLDNPVKALAWFSTPNPMLGEVTPNEMLAAGRVERLMKFIREAEMTLDQQDDER